MSVPAPHYLLFSEAKKTQEQASLERAAAENAGQWRFVLESLEGSEKVEVEDSEPHVQEERLELLAVVRGLEALDQPSRVTLVTRSRYVSRGLRFGLSEWRENNWQWEAYGEYAPVNNDDLWRRVDQAMKYHDVQCRTWRFDQSHAPQAASEEAEAAASRTEKKDSPKSLKTPEPTGATIGGRATRFVKKLLARRKSA